MHKKVLSHFQKVDHILHSLALKIEELNLSVGDDPFVKLCESIINQQLSGKAADTIFARLLKLFPREKITPKILIKIPDEKLRSCGISYSKIKYLKDLSKKVSSGFLKFDQFDQLDEESVIGELIKVKGVGRWTAEMFLMFHLAREDVFSIGDLGLKRAIEKHYLKGKKASNHQLLTISQIWSPYRTYASMVLWRSLG